jgi:hypothetical protein
MKNDLLSILLLPCFLVFLSLVSFEAPCFGFVMRDSDDGGYSNTSR